MKKPAKLQKADRDLIVAATATIKQRYRDDWQEVGAALRTRSGRVFTGVNLDAYLGRMAVCAEAVALGRAFVGHPHVSDPRRYLFGNRSAIETTPGALPLGTITRAFGS